jgi:NAD(P)H-hydrate epimerase
MGAGYVTLAVPESATAAARCHLASAVVVGMPENPSRTFASKDAERLLDLARDYDAVVLGPGLTVSRGAVVVARTLVSRLPVPLVVDADALNALVDATSLLAERQAPTLITPHPGEAGRMLCVSTDDVQANRIASARRLAMGRTVCVLKGAGTLIADASRCVVNTSGSAALATAGTGDVLAGMLGTLLAQGLAPLEAGALGAHLHGRAGEAAAEVLTPLCVRAEDVCEHVPDAVAELLSAW